MASLLPERLLAFWRWSKERRLSSLNEIEMMDIMDKMDGVISVLCARIPPLKAGIGIINIWA